MNLIKLTTRRDQLTKTIRTQIQRGGRTTLTPQERQEFNKLNEELDQIHTQIGQTKYDVLTTMNPELQPLTLIKNEPDYLTIRISKRATHDLLLAIENGHSDNEHLRRIGIHGTTPTHPNRSHHRIPPTHQNLPKHTERLTTEHRKLSPKASPLRQATPI
jgi:hypothetical protein